jgi:hypothetical protein
MSLSRRDLISIASVAAVTSLAVAGASAQPDRRTDMPSLDALAKAKRRIGFGSFLNSLARDPSQNRRIPVDFDGIKARLRFGRPSFLAPDPQYARRWCTETADAV